MELYKIPKVTIDKMAMSRTERHKRQRQIRAILEYLTKVYDNYFIEAFIPYGVIMDERLTHHAADVLIRMGLQVLTDGNGITIINQPNIID